MNILGKEIVFFFYISKKGLKYCLSNMSVPLTTDDYEISNQFQNSVFLTTQVYKTYENNNNRQSNVKK